MHKWDRHPLFAALTPHVGLPRPSGLPIQPLRQKSSVPTSGSVAMEKSTEDCTHMEEAKVPGDPPDNAAVAR